MNLEIIKVCQNLHAKNMLSAADGNVSVRLSDDEILITPSGVAKARMSPEEMAIITIDNKVIQGNPSSERLMHLQVYKSCPQAKAVVHAHPPTAIAFSVSKPELKEIPNRALSEVILACGKIPIVNYTRPGTRSMGDSLVPFLNESRVLVLARHGALTWGESLEEAQMGMERLEHSCEILFRACLMGGVTDLEDKEVEALIEIRKSIGDKII